MLYGASEWVLRRGHEVPLKTVALPTDAASLAEGARLAKIVGCRGCHGPDGEGAVWKPVDWTFGQVAPPAIARKIATYSDAELERLIRHGVRKDGSTLYIMSTGSLRYLADADVAKIIAWVRTLKPGPKDSLADTWFGPVGRAMILTGALPPSIEPGDVAPAQRPPGVGRYFYDTVCSDCHRLDQPNALHDGQTAPALAPMAASYDAAGFHRLLTTGIGRTPRDLGVMKEVALESGSAFTEAEIAAIQAYLKGEAEKLPPR